MSWLVDTNVLSELRKGVRAHAGVRAWFAGAQEGEPFTRVLVLGETRRGIESIRRRDARSALALEQWPDRLASDFGAPRRAWRGSAIALTEAPPPGDDRADEPLRT